MSHILSRILIAGGYFVITYTDSRGPTVIITETDSFYAIVITKADIIQQKKQPPAGKQETVKFVLLRSKIVIHGQRYQQQRSPSIEIINPLEKLPSGSRMVFHSKTLTKF